MAVLGRDGKAMPFVHAPESAFTDARDLIAATALPDTIAALPNAPVAAEEMLGAAWSALPIVTVVGLQFGLLLGGAIVCEMIFSWPGVGRLMIFAIYNRDFPLVEAAVFVMAMVFVAGNMLVDLCYAWLDPRVKLRA